MSWFNGATTRREVLANVPHLEDRFEALYQALWTLPQIPAEVLELCRLRMAQLHSSETEWQREERPVAASKRDRIAQWNNDPQFDAAERACLELAEVYAMDPAAISDAQSDAVKHHFGEAGLVALVEALGLFYGLTRLSQLWQLPAQPQPVPKASG